jgi:hypothetical protein
VSPQFAAVTLADARADAEELATLSRGPFASDDDVIVVRGHRLYLHRDSDCDWAAYAEHFRALYVDGAWQCDPIGKGATPEEAIKNLFERLEEAP